MATDSFTFHLALVRTTYPESQVGGGQVGTNSVVLGQVDRERPIGWNAGNLGQTAVHAALDADTESLPLCRLPDVVYLGTVAGGTYYIGRAAKPAGLRWIFLQHELGGPGRHAPCNRAHTDEVERTRRIHVPSHSSNWGGWGAAAMVSMVVPAWSRLRVLQETPGWPLQPRDQGISSLRSGGIPDLAPLTLKFWRVTQAHLNLFTKEE